MADWTTLQTKPSSQHRLQTGKLVQVAMQIQ